MAALRREVRRVAVREIDEIPAEGRINLSVQLYYDSIDLKNYFKKLYDDSKDEQSSFPDVDLKINYNGVKNLIDTYQEHDGKIILRQKSNKSAFSERQWFMSNEFFEYIPFKSGFVGCKVVVGDIESDAKLRIVPRLSFNKNNILQNYLMNNEGKDVTVKLKLDNFEFNEFELETTKDYIKGSSKFEGKNYKIIPVGANWTDNTNIVGYYNIINEEYHFPPAFELIKKAKSNKDKPYFLILDEMNLSHVERYFADFLSAIESDEEIPLNGCDKSLALPKNLFIIGTVNVDETTYMFSPKVLDRANTIEFDTILAQDYMMSLLDNDDFAGDVKYLQSPLYDSDITQLKITDLKEILSNVSCEGESLWSLLSDELTSFQKILKNSSFDFGFRVINEILRFIVVAWRYENSPKNWENWERYFDAQIKQKILPKMHGSEKAIGDVLNKLFILCLKERNENTNPKNFNVVESDCRYYTSALKLQNMLKVLSDQRYVSFIN